MKIKKEVIKNEECKGWFWCITIFDARLEGSIGEGVILESKLIFNSRQDARDDMGVVLNDWIMCIDNLPY